MTPYYDRDGITIYCGDCLEVMPGLDGTFDAVITDPPYGIGYESNWKTQLDGTSRETENSFGDDKVNTDWLVPAFELIKDVGFVYVFTRWDVINLLTAAMVDAKFKVVQRLVWNKLHWKMGDLHYYGSQLEDIVFCVKGRPNLQWEKRQGNLYNFSSFYLPEGQVNHPTQKPVALIKSFILDAVDSLGAIIDPFMGSGTTLVAAQNEGRRAVGIEISEDYCKIAVERLRQPSFFSIPNQTNGKVEAEQLELLT